MSRVSLIVPKRDDLLTGPWNCARDSYRRRVADNAQRHANRLLVARAGLVEFAAGGPSDFKLLGIEC